MKNVLRTGASLNNCWNDYNCEVDIIFETPDVNRINAPIVLLYDVLDCIVFSIN